ncbi:MAG: hypothetical protein ACJAT4_002381 [Granulosicoccus sp.]|jgi:hypothetical protein
MILIFQIKMVETNNKQEKKKTDFASKESIHDKLKRIKPTDKLMTNLI